MKKNYSGRLINKVISALLITAIIVSCSFIPASAADNSNEPFDPIVVVSLGDSYSSGEGIEPFYGQDKRINSLNETDNKLKDRDWLAHRSTLSWPSRLQFAGMPDGTFTGDYKASGFTHGRYYSDDSICKWYFVASSGAETKHITTEEQNKKYKQCYAVMSNEAYITGEAAKIMANGNYGTLKDWGTKEGDTDLPKQLDIFKEIGGESVDYVTLTIGGNDVGFSKIIETCFLPTYVCPSVVSSAYTDIVRGRNDGNIYVVNRVLTGIFKNMWEKQNEIEKNLKQTYSAIHYKAINATIIVAGYPELLDRSGGGKFFSISETNYVDDQVIRFNEEIIKKVVTECQSKMDIEFVPVVDEFKGHQANAKDKAGNSINWINPIMYTQNEDLVYDPLIPASMYSIHPNDRGAQAYADCVNKKIQEIEKKNQQNGQLSGTVYKDSDKIAPVSSALVRVFKNDKKTLFTLASADSNGNYCIDLPVGDYYISITSNGYIDSNYTASVKMNNNTYTETFLVEENKNKGYTISGTIKGEDGEILSGAKVAIFDENGSLLKETASSNSGGYSFDVDKSSTKKYTLTFEKDGYITQSKAIIDVAEDRTLDVTMQKDTNNPNIPADAPTFNGHTYYLYTGYTWQEAKDYCESVGGHLATITSQEEMDFIVSDLESKNETANCYWIGLQRDGDTWKWITDEPFSYSNWAENEPNNYEDHGENVVHLFGKEYTEGKGTKYVGAWNDVTNEGAEYAADFYALQNFGYICEWDSVNKTDPLAYSQYFALEPVVSRYGSETVDEYGARLQLNDGAVIRKCAVYMYQDGEEWHRAIAFVGENITSATYVPYVAFQGNIVYDGTTHNKINTYNLYESSDGIWCENTIHYADLKDSNGNDLTLRSKDVVGRNVQIFDDQDAMKSWLLS